MKNKPLFFVVEGGDGVGKGIQIELLKNYLESRDYRVTVSREPGGSEVGEKIRSFMSSEGGGAKLSPEAELMLFLAGRFQHAKELIIPFRLEHKSGTALILDRYFFSTFAYQLCDRNLRASSSMSQIYKSQIDWLFLNDAIPDAFFVFDLEPEIALKRIEGRGEKTSQDALSMDSKRAIRFGMLEACEKWNKIYSQKAFIVYSAESPEKIHEHVRSLVDRYFID